MKKNKKKVIITTLVALISVAAIIFIFFTINFRNKNALSLDENKWLDSNRHNVIDIAVINEIPVLSYDGNGLFYDYINYISDKYSLKFNMIPYRLDNPVDYDYKVDIVNQITDDDITLIKDNLVLITKSNSQYTTIDNINNLKLGVLASDKEYVSNYLNNGSIELIEFNTYDELKKSMVVVAPLENSTESGDSQESVNVDGIIIPKLVYTKDIIKENYKISFQFNDLAKYFVLKINSNKQLSGIMKKGYNSWKKNNYNDSYNSNLLSDYFEFKEVSDSEQKKLQSKSYVYGFIEYGIYNHLKSNKISGINEIILKDFIDFTGLSIKYTKYNSINKMLSDFENNKVDFIMNITNINIDDSKVYSTVGTYNKQLVVISGSSNNDVIESIYSLKDKELLTIKDSYLENYLTTNGIKVKSYNNLKDLTTDFKENSIVLIDLDNYDYYKTSAFKNSKIDYIFKTSDKYKYIINNTEENVIFESLFDFYLNYNSVNELIMSNYSDIAYENVNIIYILIFIIIALCIYLVLDFSNHVKYMISRIKKNKKIHLSKQDKIKYIDQLTSLKNRAYLNSKIETWDESEVYPQAIIVIDLNNVSYINDNYGREEGDKVITEAANILIQNQLENSEIIRTDGNEFLIYLVGHNEKQVISYLRKLNKEFKTLSHGFGAASGYSIITDAIKTFDDAVNEATLDMKNNKEDIDY